MATAAKFGKRERTSPTGLSKVLVNLKSGLTRSDILAGLLAAAVISALLVGFRYQSIPKYKAGDIADQDVRALQNVTYEDPAATTLKREAARVGVPAVFDMRTDLISKIEREFSQSFSIARDVLTILRIPQAGQLSPAQQRDITGELEKKLPKPFPPDVLSVFLRQRFSTVLEGQILKVVDGVLREGIIQDRSEFLKEQRSGITVRDLSTDFERPLPAGYMARDLTSARENLRQFHLEFSSLAARDRATIIGYLETQLVPTLTIAREETSTRREAAASQVPPVVIQIKRGKAIVRSGEEVSGSTVSQLQALRALRKQRPLLWQFAGFLFFVSVFIYALWRYFVFYQTRHKKIRNHTVLVLVIITSVLIVLRLSTLLADTIGARLSLNLESDPINLYYAIPLVFGSLLVTLLVDINVGMITSVIISTLVGLFFGSVEIAAYVLIGSIAGIYSVQQYNDRAAILKAGLTIAIVGGCSLISIDLLRQMPFVVSVALSKAGYAFASGLLTASLSSILLPALESGFKIVTNIRLLELSNLNAPILRRLSVEAPGTYHHSLMVATLAESAAEAIGANPLLVRVGAYYHDLGKLLKPEYYIENQAFGVNKHENLSPSMSCLIISSHVKDGYELAREAGLPQRIRDMIPQHHGTRIMTYFYQKARELANGKNQEVKEADFRYPGPKPQSKEAAVLMMSDSIEAASRTLSDPTPAQIQGMISRLVDMMVADSQFNECDITLREVSLVKENFLKILTGIFHRRIDYPGYDFKTIGNEPVRPLRSTGSKQAKAI